MFIPYIDCYFISFFFLFIGALGLFLGRRNLILIIMCVELMLLSIQLNLIVSSYNFNDLIGQIFCLFILMIAAAEVALGLALIILQYRLKGTIETKFIYLLKG